MTIIEVAKISSKGQITIPVSVRDKLKLKTGDKIVIFDENDYILYMDSNNLRNLRIMTRGDQDGKISKVLGYTKRGGDISDPWYTKDFNCTYKDLETYVMQ